MPDTVEEFEPEEPEEKLEIEKKVRSRFRVVLVHVLKTCVFLPFPIKYLLFAIIAIAKPPLAAAIVLWAVGSVAVYVFSLRRSLSSIRKKVTVVNPEGCIVPSIIGFGLFAFFNLFIDLALATNSGTNAGPLILLSVLLTFCVFAYQSLMTQREFAATEGANPKLPTRVFGILIAAGDLAIVVGFVAFIVAAINGAF
ncbi:hypothetical protein [uncultured Gimesia sp.]|uniref:hypothetical protein n=1 Tax=uncultured Gimesia sp. TaxID=1678688 RepID=UPI00262C4D04|nr:hypothetical protein [uncultured Gimesia sp.]